MLDFESRFRQKNSLFLPEVWMKLDHVKNVNQNTCIGVGPWWQRGIIFYFNLNQILVKREHNNSFL
jgi:hypothetical protein